MITVYDDRGREAGYDDNGVLTAADTPPGKRFGKWIKDGVRVLQGTEVDGGKVIIEKEDRLVKPDHPFFGLALLQRIELEGWKAVDLAKEGHPSVINVFCPTGPGGGVDPSCSPSEARGGAAPRLSGPAAEEAAKEHAEDIGETLISFGPDSKWTEKAVKGAIKSGVPKDTLIAALTAKLGPSKTLENAIAKVNEQYPIELESIPASGDPTSADHEQYVKVMDDSAAKIVDGYGSGIDGDAVKAAAEAGIAKQDLTEAVYDQAVAGGMSEESATKLMQAVESKFEKVADQAAGVPAGVPAPAPDAHANSAEAVDDAYKMAEENLKGGFGPDNISMMVDDAIANGVGKAALLTGAKQALQDFGYGDFEISGALDEIGAKYDDAVGGTGTPAPAEPEPKTAEDFAFGIIEATAGSGITPAEVIGMAAAAGVSKADLHAAVDEAADASNLDDFGKEQAYAAIEKHYPDGDSVQDNAPASVETAKNLAEVISSDGGLNQTAVDKIVEEGLGKGATKEEVLKEIDDLVSTGDLSGGEADDLGKMVDKAFTAGKGGEGDPFAGTPAALPPQPAPGQITDKAGTPLTAENMPESMKSGAALAAYVDANKGDTPFSPLYLAKLDHLNAGGIKDGTFYIPTFPKGEKSSLEKVAQLQIILPPGTIIKQKKVTAEDLEKAGKTPPKGQTIGKPKGSGKAAQPTATPTPAPAGTKAGDLKAGQQYTAASGTTYTVTKVGKPDGAGNVEVHVTGPMGPSSFKAPKDDIIGGKVGPTPTATPTPTPAAGPPTAQDQGKNVYADLTKGDLYKGGDGKVYTVVGKAKVSGGFNIKLKAPDGTVIPMKVKGWQALPGKTGSPTPTGQPATPAPSDKTPDGQPLSAGPLPKTYGGLKPGHTYVNTVSQQKTIEDVQPGSSPDTIKVKFKGEQTYYDVDKNKAIPDQTVHQAPKKSPSVPYTPPPKVEPGSKPYVPNPAVHKVAKGTTPPPDHASLPPIPSNGKVKLAWGTDTHGYDQAEHAAWAKSLTSSEKSAISSWKGSASDIRKAVATGTMDDEATAFMSAIEKSPAYQGVTYRGVHGPYADKLAAELEATGVGGHWTEPAPHCMTPNPYVGNKFSQGQLMFRIISKTGRPIKKSDGFSSDDPKDEHEITGMPGTKYKIAAISKNVSTSDTKNSYHGYSKIAYVIDLVEE